LIITISNGELPLWVKSTMFLATLGEIKEKHVLGETCQTHNKRFYALGMFCVIGGDFVFGEISINIVVMIELVC